MRVVRTSSREESRRKKKGTSGDLARCYISFYVVLLFQTGAQNWSINSLLPSALQDVMMWNANNQKS